MTVLLALILQMLVPINIAAADVQEEPVSVIKMEGTGLSAFVNSVDGAISWSVTVNESKISMANPILDDTLPTGLEYVAGTFRLDGYREDEGGFFGTLTTDSESVSYEFGKEIKEKHIIEFQTKVTDYKKLFANSSVAFTNTAKLSSTSLNGGEQSSTASKSFTSEVINQSVATGYDYTTKRTKWRIVVNKNKIPMTNAIINDTMPEGVAFVSGTFDVVNESNVHVTSSAGALVYVCAGDDIWSLDSFTYTFSSTADTHTYTITYETEMKDKYLKENQFSAPKSFINKADITESNYAKTVSSSANQTVKNPIVEIKSSYIKGADTIDWTIPINIAKSSWADGLEITDDLQIELELDLNTVKLYYMNVNSDGTLSKLTLVPKTEYDLLYKDKKLTVSIHGPITSAYQLEFTTDVLSDLVDITNSISQKGSSISTTCTSNKVRVNVNDVTSIFFAKQGKITISKVDSADGIAGLSGAVFQLYDIRKLPIIGKIGTTDANGKLVFDSLPLRTYYLGEITAPDGYVADKELSKVNIDVAILNTNVEFCNQKALGDIEFLTQNESAQPLAGAEFTLYKKGSSTAIKTSVSDASGKVIFVNIGTGDYEIKETKAPDGYQISKDIISAKVEIQNNSTVAKVNLSKDVIKNSKTVAPDKTAPTLSAQSASSLTTTSATLNFTSDEAGNYYYLVYSAAEAAPNAAKIKSQIGGAGMGAGAASAGVNKSSVTGLTASTAYKAYVIVEDAASNISAVSTIAFTTAAQTSTASSGSTTQSASYEGNVDVFIDGITVKGATIKVEEKNGIKSTIVVLDDAVLKEKIDKMNQVDKDNKVLISENNKSNKVTGQLTGQAIKNMASKNVVFELKTENSIYTIPASEINIDEVSKKLGIQGELKDIIVNVTVSSAQSDIAKIVQDTADKNNYKLVVKPVEFEITCTSGGKTVEVSKFNGYVERCIEIPEGIDPSKITTGVVVNRDGTFSHVPTAITVIGGKHYAKINSRTNSIYTVIWNPVTFKDVENHWSKKYVNDAGSRLIDSGVGNGNFAPDRAITRAEFAEKIVKALGLKGNIITEKFSDVKKGDPYYEYIYTANQYGILAGYPNGKFGPSDLITREQAMQMISKAIGITGMNITVSSEDVKNLSRFIDSKEISAYAEQAAAICVKSGLFAGNEKGMITPNDNFTRAESATVIIKLLKAAEYIDN